MIGWWWLLPFAIVAIAALYCGWHLIELARVCAAEARQVLARTRTMEREEWCGADDAPDTAPQTASSVPMAKISPERILQARAALRRLRELTPPPSGAVTCAKPGCIAWINPQWMDGSGWTQALDGSWRCAAHPLRELTAAQEGAPTARGGSDG